MARNFDFENDLEYQKIRKQVASWARPKRPKPFLLGYDRETRRVYILSEKNRAVHMHIIGASGKGKTQLALWMMRRDIDARRGFSFLDWTGNAYGDVLKYVVNKGLRPKDVILIDPNESDFATGLNWLQRTGEDIDVQAGRIMRRIAKVFGGESQDAMPRLQRWERNSIIPLIAAGLTMAELPDFLSLEDSEFRQLILREVKDYFIHKEWSEFEALRRQEKEVRLESVLNRAAKFITSQKIRRILGQARSTIDWEQVLVEGKIVLVNLGQSKISEEAAKLLGIIILDQIIDAAKRIPKGKRKRFYIYLDEFQNFVSEDIARALNELRQFGISMVLAHQHLHHLKEESGTVYHAVLGNAHVKVAFGGLSREDSEIIEGEFFTGEKHGDVVKDEIYQTKFRPVETTRVVTSHGHVESEQHGSSHGHVDSHMHGSAKGGAQIDSESSGSAKSSGQSSQASVGSAQVFLSDQAPGDIPLISTPISTTETSTEGHGEFSSQTEISLKGHGDVSSWSEQDNFGSSVSYSEHDSYGSADTYTESEVPFYEYEEFRELSSRNYWSLAEQAEEFIAEIKNQEEREAIVKIGTDPPVKILTPWVKEVRVREKDIEAFKRANFALYARHVEEVDRDIESRRTFLLSQAAQSKLGMPASAKISQKATSNIASIASVEPKEEDFLE